MNSKKGDLFGKPKKKKKGIKQNGQNLGIL